MKRISAGLSVVLLGGLVGCAAPAKSLPVAATPACPAAPPPTPPGATQLPAVVATITQQYHAIAEHELEAITRDGVTPRYITAVKAADAQANAAVLAMSKRLNRTIENSVEQARASVQRLASLLVKPPAELEAP